MRQVRREGKRCGLYCYICCDLCASNFKFQRVRPNLRHGASNVRPIPHGVLKVDRVPLHIIANRRRIDCVNKSLPRVIRRARAGEQIVQCVVHFIFSLFLGRHQRTSLASAPAFRRTASLTIDHYSDQSPRSTNTVDIEVNAVMARNSHALSQFIQRNFLICFTVSVS
jgi:hypothetical protein